MKTVGRGDPGYPEELERIADPPARLFVRGVLPDPPSVAIVGSRRCTRYGSGLARRLAHAVAAAGWAVVSGLARGIDTAAHVGALEGGGTTTAVLGCGPDIWYPASNRELGERILADGAVISEYEPGTPPAAWRFPERNRIIVGLSQVVVVVEAAERSGALITARLAMENGIDVLAVPGDLDRATSAGANRLIADGAHPIVDAGEIVEMVERIVGPAPVGVDVPAPVVDGPMFLHEVAAVLGMTIGDAARRVAEWEMAGLVRREAGMIEPVLAD